MVNNKGKEIQYDDNRKPFTNRIRLLDVVTLHYGKICYFKEITYVLLLNQYIRRKKQEENK